MRVNLLNVMLILVTLCGSQCLADEKQPTEQDALAFYNTVMGADPILPANLDAKTIGCALNDKPISSDYLNSRQARYEQHGWEGRVSADWSFFQGDDSEGRITVIDFRHQDKGVSYRYLSNGTQHKVYEPWSSSKVLAFTGAISQARKAGVSDVGYVGEFALADLITSVNSYEAFGKADGNSNAIASYFVNLAGRDYLTALFHDEWLKLSNEKIFFRGAYGTDVFDPLSSEWRDEESEEVAVFSGFTRNSEDPGYRSYRCDDCGLTGNKPMTTLAQAEWLKRLAAHERDPLTQHPELKVEDIQLLFYGVGHTQEGAEAGGMLAGISHALSLAIARHISSDADLTSKDAKRVLDTATNGEWRIFQKIGWGPSETRNTGENVMLAHVCLPEYQGGREFTVAAQASHPEAKESSVGYSGMKMQRLLDTSIAKLLATQ
ncbi:hypothetical protein DRW07_11265 [Alteromonas sediminis]|uniref:Tle cognate immunity protein 4 C-terminal domain-containing protein n=1 Tax=Alteromonas sediminis TaxID=2259342 RepID=A0A3N5YMK2_9ALTE|nr:hypothetical protein [Alteromonas sediminis]RPJ66651.1 hypothetical protein DRW07_11265 [Alteromonas sediminis]